MATVSTQDEGESHFSNTLPVSGKSQASHLPCLQAVYRTDARADEQAHRGKMAVIDWLADPQRGGSNWHSILTDALKTSAQVDIEEYASRVLVNTSRSGHDWRLQFEHPDRRFPQRRWRLDTFVSRYAQHDEYGFRLSCLTSEAPRPAMSTGLPRFVRTWMSECDLYDSGHRLTEKPWFPTNEVDFRRFVDFLQAPVRRLPVVVATQRTPRHGDPYYPVLPARLAGSLAGIAHVVALNASQATQLRLQLGKMHSVFHGAVRTYMPGFGAKSNCYDHPLIRPVDPEASTAGSEYNSQRLVDLIATRLRSNTQIQPDSDTWSKFDLDLARTTAPSFFRRIMLRLVAR